MEYKLGWIPDVEDKRDISYSVELLKPIKTVYLSDNYVLPAPYDQGRLGSCTGNGIAFLIHFDLLNKHSQSGANPFLPSRLFIYYFEREIEGTILNDAGAQIRDGIKVVAKWGTPPEDLWPYDIDMFSMKPSDQAINEALKFQALSYRSVDNTNKELLVNTLMDGYPIVFGMTIYKSFPSAAQGIIPYPRTSEKILGGHCMSIVGYSLEYDAFIVRNSWGPLWGQNGYCRIPAAYICNRSLARDFWIIKTIE